MGSFNVSCSVSNLSITPGTRCFLLPLFRNSYHFPEHESLGSMFVSESMPAHFFYPFSFPIVGEYDDYGRIANIERTKTVEILEKFFGATADQLVDILTNGREATDSCSGLFSVFGIDKGKEHYNFSAQYLLDIGFTKTEVSVIKNGVTTVKTGYRFENHEAFVRVFMKALSTSRGKEKHPHYKIYSKGKFRKMGGIGSLRYFLKDYLSVTGYFLNYPEDKQESVKLLSKLSGAFIHGDVYDSLSAFQMGDWGKPDLWETSSDVNEHTLTSLGFLPAGTNDKIERYNKIYKHPAVDSHFIGTDGTWSHFYKVNTTKPLNESVYHPDAFIKVWAKETGHQLEIQEVLKGTSPYVAMFDVYRQAMVELDELEKKIKTLPTEERDLSLQIWCLKEMLMKSKFTFNFIPIYREGKFTEMYSEVIKDNSIKEEFVKFANFFSNLHTMNKFLFPGPYAGQIGNNWGQKFLANKVHEIVTKEEAQEKWEDDE